VQIGFLSFWNNYREHMSDAEFFKKEHAVNLLAEPLGFDTFFRVEHHFNAYSMSPDNFSVPQLSGGPHQSDQARDDRGDSALA